MMTTETMCDRCNEAPAHTYNEDHEMAVCESCHAYFDKHVCAGDNCVCIGGDEDLTPRDDDAEIEPWHSDYSDDADALASAGWGTDEDYGYYGDD
jgi:hypothetical protein